MGACFGRKNKPGNRRNASYQQTYCRYPSKKHSQKNERTSSSCVEPVSALACYSAHEILSGVFYGVMNDGLAWENTQL